MALLAGCGVLVIVALALGIRWRHVAFVTAPARPAEADSRDRAWYAVRVTLRQVVIVVLAGMVTGLLFVGPTARLAMRLLAATGGDRAQGQVTEAGEIVGAITVEGTIGLIIFVGLGSGLLSSLAYGLMRRILPAGPAGGALLGLALFVIVGPTLDPIRADNPDFGIVGPGWLALLVFLAMAVVQGSLLAVAHARLSHAVPLVSRARPSSALWLLALVPLVPTAFPPLLLLVLLLVAASAAWGPKSSAGRGGQVRLVGRLAVIVVVGASVPGLVAAVVAIL